MEWHTALLGFITFIHRAISGCVPTIQQGQLQFGLAAEEVSILCILDCSPALQSYREFPELDKNEFFF